MQRLGIFGGLFNPVHCGHLRIAIECKEQFAIDELRMIPCSEPPHKMLPGVSAEHRLNMLSIAMQNVQGVTVDSRELARTGLSYTVDTLHSLKADCPNTSIYLILGSDAFQTLNEWHQWESILENANIIIAQRPDNPDNQASQVGKILTNCFTKDIDSFKKSHAGKIYALNVSQLEISSSQIRKLLREKKSAQFLLPQSVLDYIEENNIYE